MKTVHETASCFHLSSIVACLSLSLDVVEKFYPRMKEKQRPASEEINLTLNYLLVALRFLLDTGSGLYHSVLQIARCVYSYCTPGAALLDVV